MTASLVPAEPFQLIGSTAGAPASAALLPLQG